MARRVIAVKYDCNRCGRKGCKGDLIREHRTGRIKQHLSCPGMVQPNVMRTTLLERASENDGSMMALGQILQELDLQFDQVPRYPYFRFINRRTDTETIS